MLKPKKNEIRKPTKTISGVTPIAVMLPPRKCKHGTCLYCPSLNVPQSYTPKSPAVLRAKLIMMLMNRLKAGLRRLKL
jgi:histone acetyltransferase (RNA polymerase elongator complex component)